MQKFFTLMLNIPNMDEELHVQFFRLNLQLWARKECLRHHATTLDEIKRIVESLDDYQLHQQTQDRIQHSHEEWHGHGNGCQGCDGECTYPTTLALTTPLLALEVDKLYRIGCFNYNRSHWKWDYLGDSNKLWLNTIQLGDNDEGSEEMINSFQIFNCL